MSHINRIDDDLERLLEMQLPEFDASKCEWIPEPVEKDFHGVELITPFSATKDAFVFVVKSIHHAIRFIEVPCGKLSVIALLAASLGINMPDPKDLLLKYRSVAIDALSASSRVRPNLPGSHLVNESYGESLAFDMCANTRCGCRRLGRSETRARLRCQSRRPAMLSRHQQTRRTPPSRLYRRGREVLSRLGDDLQNRGGHKLIWKTRCRRGILHAAASGWGGVVAKAICGLSSGRRGFVLGPRSPALKSNDPGRLCRGTNSSRCL